MTTDAEFLQKLRLTFYTEADEHLQVISAGLAQLERLAEAQGRKPVIELVFRAAHSLKGAARAVELDEIERVCGQLEDTFASWKLNTSAPTRTAISGLHHSLDEVAALLAKLSPARPVEPRAAVALGPPEVASPTIAPEAPVAGARSLPVAPAKTVRVRADLLDARLLEAEEMLALKLASRQRVEELKDLDRRLREWRTQRALSDVDQVREIQLQVTEMLRLAGQDSEAAGKLIDELLVNSKLLLLQPFATVASGLPRLVRELCAQLGKQAELVITGEHHQIDKSILDDLKDPLIHLLRNAVDHGLEKPEERMRSGKPARGRIELTVAQLAGGRVQITLTDDGRGIAIDRLKATGVHLGLLLQEEVDRLPAEEATALVFHSGLSTSQLVTNLSGRGLGLAIVQEKARGLGGEARVYSRTGAGTTFEIVVPALRATFRGVLVQAADRLLVLPTTSVERTGQVQPSEIVLLEGRDTWTLEGRVLPVIRLANLLELPEAGRTAVGTALQLVVLGRGNEQVALAVDRVLDEQEFLVKRLSPPLLRVRHISAATVLPDGRVAFILNVPDLLLSARRAPATMRAARLLTDAKPKAILVAEDSITSRMLLQGILEAAGYRVSTARDGLDALARLRADDFDLVVTDVEMPRLNGFDLTARIRADRRLREIPVVLVTTLEQKQHRERGVDVGANAYIVKSSFEQGTLLETVRSLL